MNAFRMDDGKLDRKYLRTCAVHRMIGLGKITSREVALELLEQKHGKDGSIEGALDLWLKNQFKLLPIAKEFSRWTL